MRRSHAQSCAARSERHVLRADQRPSSVFASMTKRPKMWSSRRVFPRARRGRLNVGVDTPFTAIERFRADDVLRRARSLSSNMAPSRACVARDVVAGPHVGHQACRRSTAAGQNVRPGAQAPGTRPLGCLELAAADLGAAPLALVTAGNIDLVSGFAFARHGNSLRIAISAVEFFAFVFLKSRDLRRKAARHLQKIEPCTDLG